MQMSRKGHKMTAKDNLRKWITGKKLFGSKYIQTSEICKWGVDNFSNRAVRNSNDLAHEGFIKRVPRHEAILMGFTGNEGIWEIL